MAYDPVAAHEYYIKYRKKGLLKGRKKGKKKTTTSKKKGKKSSVKKQKLVGLSTGGLNDSGKMQWAMAKESLTTQMNADLAKAKTDQEKQQIRQAYQNKALQELQKIKSDPSMAKQKTTSSKTKSSGSSKSSSKSGSSKSSSKSSSNEDTSSSSSNSEKLQSQMQEMSNMVDQLIQNMANFTPEQKTMVLQSLSDIVKILIAQKTGTNKR